MASGAVTGWQHQLIDMEELTREKFIEFCDRNFYHLDHYGHTTIEDRKKRLQEETQRHQEKMDEKELRISFLQRSSEETLRKDYEIHVKETEEANENFRKSYERESKRFELIAKYMDELKPHLDYIWKEFKQPTLYQREVPTQVEWFETELRYAQSSYEFYKEHRDKAMKDLGIEKNENSNVYAYEEAKKKFLNSVD